MGRLYPRLSNGRNGSDAVADPTRSASGFGPRSPDLAGRRGNFRGHTFRGGGKAAGQLMPQHVTSAPLIDALR